MTHHQQACVTADGKTNETNDIDDAAECGCNPQTTQQSGTQQSTTTWGKDKNFKKLLSRQFAIHMVTSAVLDRLLLEQ